MTTLRLRKSIGRSPLRLAFLLISLVLACFAFSPMARAQLNPPPDGGYPNQNTAEGDFALFSLTTGTGNTANGYLALFGNTTGSYNTANGDGALQLNTGGSYNTANGSLALFNNTTGSYNTANGDGPLQSNTTGTYNTANGSLALFSNTTGNDNTANGGQALLNNTTGNNNTANGVSALQLNTGGSDNTANGFNALLSNTTGNQNTAEGVNALKGDTTGNDNTANGSLALFSNTTGNQNTANGSQALVNNTTGIGNTANGVEALISNTTGGSNIALGFLAGQDLTTGSNNIEIGNPGMVGEANTIRIGAVGTQQATFIAGISGKKIPGGATVVIGADGHLGTISPSVSSRRFKEQINPMANASEAILALKPVTFRYKHELDPDGLPQFGLVAEEVEKVNPALVARDAEGKVYTVRYEAVNAMLLNEFLKQHCKVEEQERRLQEQGATITQLKDSMKILTASLKEQAVQIQKVNAQLEANRIAPQIVANTQ